MAGEQYWTIPTALRQRAEAHRRDHPTRPFADLPEEEIELHHIELELQNTDLREAQAALAASEQRYRDMFELAPVAYLDLDTEGRILQANRRAVRLFGTDTIVGRALAGFMSQVDADELHRQLAAAAQDGSDAHLAAFLRLEGGRQVPVDIDTIAVTDGAAGLVGYRTVLHDRSRLARARSEMHAAEAQSTSILDTATDGIVTIDGTGRITSANRATERMFGYASSELIGQDVSVLMPDHHAQAHGGYLERYLRTGEARILGKPDRLLQGRRRDGTVFPLSLGIGEWKSVSGQRFTGILRDMTEQVERERLLRKTEQRFRQIAEHVSDVFLIYDRTERRVTYISPRIDKITGGIAPQDGADIGWDWIHEDDVDTVRDGHRRMLEGHPFDHTFRIRRSDGEIRWVRGRSFPVTDETGQTIRDVGVLQDVTERRSLERALQHSQKMEALGTLAAGVAHDFGNVLQGILGCLTVATDDATPPEQAADLLERATDATRRGGELAASLMRFSRREDVQPTQIALDETLRGFIPLVQRLMTEQSEVRFEAGAGDAQITIAPTQLQQIILNLSANAKDAMPSGGTLTIETRIETLVRPTPNSTGVMAPGDYACVTITDTGDGMDASTCLRAFEPFFTTKESGRGTGLGLATVFALLKRLDGHVHLHSEVGTGTRFTFHFPIADGANTVDTVGAQTLPRFDGRVLVVEDDEIVRLSLSVMLEKLGFDVLQAPDPVAALNDTASTADLALLITDVTLPMMHGPMLATQIRDRFPELPVLFITASAEPSVLAHGLDGTATLEKPFELDQLTKSITALLEN